MTLTCIFSCQINSATDVAFTNV